MAAFQGHRSFLIGVLGIMIAGVFIAAQARPASGDSMSELEARVAELVAIVQSLQRQLALQQGWTTLTRDLTIGDSGGDVRTLQRVLNTQSETQVAVSGDGAPGSETMYFGPKTADAVRRYQELHRDEILIPEGLFSGTGYVGARTRAHMNDLITDQRILAEMNAEEAVMENEPPAPGSRESIEEETPVRFDGDLEALLEEFDVDPAVIEETIISGISSYHARRGDTVTISGYGFRKEENVLKFGDVYKIENLESPDQHRITFTIPENMPLGVHYVTVIGENGESEFPMLLIVYEGRYDPPEVTRITPTEGLYGERVTLHGSGFSKENNTIRASYGLIEGVPSPDGTTLTFEVKPNVEGVALEDGEDLGLDLDFQYYFFVINDSGHSTEPVSFTLRI